MRRDVRQAVGSPDSGFFLKKCIIYGIILALMLFAAPALFGKIMVPMAATGIRVAWFTVFVPLAAAMMAISLFRSWRRRWPLGYMNWFNREAKANNYEVCPRCGSAIVEKKRRRSHRVKTGELVTTTTYTDGSKTVDRKDVYGTELRTEYYYACTNSRCALEVDQAISDSHLPWKMKEIRCLVLNDDSLLGRKHPSARSILLSRLLMTILAILLVLICAVNIYLYADYQDGEWIGITVDREADRSATEYANYLLGMDSESPNWEVSYEIEPSDMMSYLGEKIDQGKTVGYYMASYQTDDGVVMYYDFYGYDAGVDIPNGQYTLRNLDGVMVIIDDTNEKIYKQDSEFYTTYAPKLLELSHDKEVNRVLELVKDGEHGIYNSALPVEFLRKDNTTLWAYMNSEDNSRIQNEFRAATSHPEEEKVEKWIFTYTDYEYVPDSLEGYVYADAVPLYDENSALGKLIKKSNKGDGDYELYRNGEVVISVDVETLANGYEFCFDEWEDSLGLGFEKDIDYRLNTNEKTLTKIEIGDDYREIAVELPLSQYQKQYDYLLSIVPERYIFDIIDMDEATLKKEYLGIIKNYQMKDENGNVTAEMKVMFGVIGEVIHHTGENEYAKIELSY